MPAYLFVHCRAGAVHFALDGSDFGASAELIARSLSPGGARRVLELASGMGYNAVRLARHLPRAEITGVDITPCHVRLARLRARRQPRVGFALGDFHRLDFAPNSFDAVCAVEGLCHAHDLPKALGEVARVLRPGGRFIVIDGFLRKPPALSDDQRRAVRLISSAFAVTHTWTLDDLVLASERVGLRGLSAVDLTARVLPSVDRGGRIARRWFASPRRARLFSRLLSPKLTRNAIASLLAPHALRTGAGAYHALVLEHGG